jgi:hypothetical protein
VLIGAGREFFYAVGTHSPLRQYCTQVLGILFRVEMTTCSDSKEAFSPSFQRKEILPCDLWHGVGGKVSLPASVALSPNRPSTPFTEWKKRNWSEYLEPEDVLYNHNPVAPVGQQNSGPA